MQRIWGIRIIFAGRENRHQRKNLTNEQSLLS